MTFPNLLSLLNKFVESHDDAEIQSFFNTKRKPTKAWLETLHPGIEAGQVLLKAHSAETNGQNPMAPVEESERTKLCQTIFGTSDLAHLRRIVQIASKEGIAVMIEPTPIAGKFDVEIRRTSQLFPAKAETDVGGPAKDLPPVDQPVHKPAPPVEQPIFREPRQETEPLIPAPLMPLSETPDTRELLNHLRPKLRLSDGHESLDDCLRAVLEGRWSRRVSMLLPMYSDVSPHVAYSWLAQIRKQPWMGVHYFTDTVIQRARNVLAHEFLKSEAEWAFWLDSDVIAPFNDGGFFFADNRLCADPNYIKPQFVEIMAVERMMKAQKTIVGGIYQMRKAGPTSTLVAQPALYPRNNRDREIVERLHREGPIDQLYQVGFVATGCALMHRRVFTDIKNRFPERQPENPNEPFDFFGHDVGKGGEDIAFCELARQAGHESWLDLGLWCGHIGRQCFFPPRR